MQLQELQWKYYHHIGTTQNIWKHRFSKQYAAKYSIYPTYGRSKSLIEHRLKQIAQHLEKAQNAIQEFKVEIFSKCTQHDTCVSVMNKLSSIIYQMVQEKQKQLYCEFEYKREMLVLDATDHQLFQIFSDLQPNKAHVRKCFPSYHIRIYFYSSILVDCSETYMGSNKTADVH